ncbi:MAG: DUF3489 domain-containing protein [Bryobacteraceae bacterium]|nr:DUF3489 domain-containing protein [Bryobacteraceae bacterium]
MTEYIKVEHAFLAYERAPDTAERFRTYGEFTKVGKAWSGKEVVELYNRTAATQGKEPVKRFMNREAGMKRLWGLIQELPVTPQHALPSATADVANKQASKKDTVLRMVQQPAGATLDEIMSATGWQAHSVRGFLSVQRKEYDIERIKRTDEQLAYYATKKPAGA